MRVLASFSSARLVAAIAGGVLVLAAEPAPGLIMVGKGNTPVHDPGWPAGSLQLANLKERVGWTEGPPFGGGQWTFYYRGGTEKLQAALKTFSAIAADRLEVVLHSGQGVSSFLNNEAYDWSFEVWVPANWQRLFNDPSSIVGTTSPNAGKAIPAPRLDVWLHAGGPDWSKLEVPANLSVQEQRATAHGFPPGSGSVVRLSVTDYDGQPLPGARLQVATTGEHAAIVKETPADSSGTSVVTGLEPGPYRLSAAAAGYAPRLLEYAHLGSNDFRVFTARLAPAGKLEGLVVDPDEKPLANATIQPMVLRGPDGLGYSMPETPKAVSDDSGRFLLSEVPAGKVQLSARLAGYHYPLQLDATTEVRTDAQAANPTIVLKLFPTGRVRVQLVDAEWKPLTFAPEEQVHVHIQEAGRNGVGSWGGTAMAGTNGVCEFMEVPPGRYRISDEPFLHGTLPSGNEVVITVAARQITETKLAHRRQQP